MNEIQLALVTSKELLKEGLELSIKRKDNVVLTISALSCSELVEKLKPGQVDVMLIDVSDFDPLEKTIFNKIIHHFPETKIMVVSDIMNKELVTQYIKDGVKGFFSKKTNTAELIKLVEKTFHNQNPFDVIIGPTVELELQEEQESLNARFKSNNFFSRREIDIVNLVAQDIPNSEIAEILGIAIRTVESHRMRMIKKVGCRSMIGVIVRAYTENERIEK